MRLRQQLVFLTLGPVVGATVLVGLVAWPIMRDALQEGREREAKQRLAAESAALQRDIGSLQARLDAYATLPAITGGTPASIAALVIPLRATMPQVEAVNFIGADGTVIRPDGSQLSVKDRYYFPSVQRGEAVVSKAILGVDTRTPEVLVLRPVRSPAGVVLGAIGASFPITGLLQRVASIRVGENGFAMLVDDDGRWVSPRRLSARATPGDFFSDAATAISPAWRALVSDMQRGGAGQRSLDLEGAPYTVFFEQVPALRWGLALAYRDDDLLQSRTALVQVTLLVVLLAALTAAAAAVYLRRRIAEPVAELLGAQAAVAAGDLTRRADVRGNDELGELAWSFNRMADQLGADQARLTAEVRSRTEATTALAEREAMFRAIFDTSPYAISIFRESDGVYLRVNPAFEQERGMTAAEVIGRPFDSVSTMRDPEARARLRAQRDRDGLLRNERLSILGPKGAPRELLLSATVFTLGDERLVLSMTTDVSETVQLETQLRQSQKLEVVGQLAGGVAHDFNNMLAGILGTANLMQMSLPPTAPEQDQLTVIVDCARRAAALTQQLLMFSRVQPSAMRRLHVHEPVTAALELAARTFDRRVIIERRLAAAHAVVLGDATLLQNVVMNLAVNARDAMPQGGTLTVTTTAVDVDAPTAKGLGLVAGQGRYIRIDVQDTGVGMSPEVRERIFEPFFTTKGLGQGTGLGLAVVYGTMREHRGGIDVVSTIGAGTTFSLFLPQAEGEVDHDLVVSSVSRGTGRLLLVDDEELVRNTTRRLLVSLGYDVVTASDGAEAVEVFLAEQDRIDAIVLDLVMPKMDGHAVFLAVRAIAPAMPVVLCSGFSSEATNRTLLAEPRVQMLAKPFGRAELSAVIAQALASAPSRG